jgi:hypothetical protein
VVENFAGNSKQQSCFQDLSQHNNKGYFLRIPFEAQFSEICTISIPHGPAMPETGARLFQLMGLRKAGSYDIAF